MNRVLVYFFLGALALTVLYVLAVTVFSAAWNGVRAYWRSRGTRVVVCPETRRYVAVELDAAHAAATAGEEGGPELRLRACTRWPERRDCDQDCVHQIENAPDGCAVRAMLADFYEGRTCALCGHEVGEIHWHDHKPALLRLEDHRTFEWQEIAPESLPEALATHLPVCWNCHVAESFRLEHPELVLDRESKSAAAHAHR
ncbi:MAG TPA: hypothetical protein VFA21_15365 [Pyrinomonadaceae bacterium]|nr:hypothetical protein [Pyrinomonadaceae bacterium]